jgi:hypothetical protein
MSVSIKFAVHGARRWFEEQIQDFAQYFISEIMNAKWLVHVHYRRAQPRHRLFDVAATWKY